jgi:hypothetical protein
LRLLLDTHVFLWWRERNPRLTPAAVASISEGEAVFVSAASGWEMAIKLTLGKLKLPGPIEPAIEDSGFEKLPSPSRARPRWRDSLRTIGIPSIGCSWRRRSRKASRS